MYRVCIATVAAVRARLFTFERNLEGEATHEELREHADLVNPGRRHPGVLLRDNRPGVNRTGGQPYAFDDHRGGFIDNLDAEFARAVIAELQRMLDDTPVQRLIACASPRMLGDLRAVGLPRRDGMVVDEVARDLVDLRVTDLRDRLASYGLLPARPPRRAAARGA